MPRIVTADELRLYLDMEGYEERVNPQLLNNSINSAETWCEAYTGRVFSPDPALNSTGDDDGTPVTKTFTVRGTGWVRIPDLRAATSVDIDGSVLTADTDYVFDDYNSGGEPHTSISLYSLTPYSSPYALAVVQRLNITGRWGWNPAPDDVKDAILALAARQYRRRDSMFADIVDRGGFSFEYTKGVPNFITDILSLYRIPRVAVV